MSSGIQTRADLLDLAERLGRPAGEVEQDFLLVQIAAQLQQDFPNQLCFKGGFVLRHAYGVDRMSVDIDATRQQPPKHKLDEGEVADSIQGAGKPLFKVRRPEAATNSKQSLDFDAIGFHGPISSKGQVAVEVSYREELCLAPIPLAIGPPYINAVIVPTMAPEEMLAEKYRTLCQRQRPTDILDAAWLWSGTAGPMRSGDVAALILLSTGFMPPLVSMVQCFAVSTVFWSMRVAVQSM